MKMTIINFRINNGLKFLLTILLYVLINNELKSQVYINELMPSNVTVLMDERDDFPDSWVEIFNQGTEDVNLKGYSFSDNNKQKDKWTLKVDFIIPAKAYSLLYFDKEDEGCHANFRLDINGGTLYMYDKELNEVDKFKYTKEIYNTSFARVPDGSSNIGPITMNSPGKSNNNRIIATERCATPKIDVEGTFFSSSVKFFATCETPDVVLRYTSTGVEPTMSSPRFPETGIEVKSNKTYRIKAFSADKLESNTLVKTFFVDIRKTDLPIVNISMNPQFLTDDYIGIYIKGKNGIIDNCTEDPRNYNQPWRRPANIQIFNKSHEDEPILNQTCELRIAGGCSRNNSQKSLIIYGNKRFGEKRFKYDMFKEKPNIELKSFMLRNAGNDYYSARLRDPFIQTLVAQTINIDYQAYAPAIIYINGNYYGIQNFRERTNEDYVLSNYGYEEDEIDLISLEVNDAYISAGNNVAYNQMLDFARENDISINSNYEILASQIDIEEYINYMFIEIFSGNRDWPGNNCKLWRPSTPGGKWRWILMDTDFGFGYNGLSSSHNTFLYAMGENYGDRWMCPEWSTVLFKNLMDNESFKRLFINRTTVALGDFLQSERIMNVCDSLTQKISSEVYNHVTNWGLSSVSSWQYEVSLMSSWPIRRAPKMLSFLQTRYNLKETVPVTIDCNLPQGNKEAIVINEFQLSQQSFYGNMFGDYGIKLKANEIENYEFDYWYVNRITSNGNTLVKRTTKEFSYELTSDIKSVEITAFYKEKEILSIDLLETKDNFTLKQFKDRVLVNYLNSKATSMELSLYNLEGVLLSKSEILDKNKEFSVIMNYPDSNEKMFILKCKTDFGIYSFKLLK